MKYAGGCDCKTIRYEMQKKPLIVHACHCTWCQRETGTAFAWNAMIETTELRFEGTPEIIDTPSASGKGQKIHRCPKCKIAVWSNYPGGGDKLSFIRVGTLDNPSEFPPDSHIFTSTKQPWVVIPEGTPAFAEFYDRKKVWRPESLERLAILFPHKK
jgi:hypothetical protein